MSPWTLHAPLLRSVTILCAIVVCTWIAIGYHENSNSNASILPIFSKQVEYGSTRALKGSGRSLSLTTHHKNNQIFDYIAASNESYKISILTWNPDGSLGDVSPINNPNMFSLEWFNGTKPSKFGSVALALSTDHLAAIPWHLDPPVPLIVYTLPNSKEGNQQYRLVPTPYEWRPQDRHEIEEAQEVTKNIPFEERINKIVWRGYKHHGPELSRVELDRLGNEKENQSWLDAQLLQLGNRQAGHMDRDEMSKYKYQIDVGGKSGTTWGALRWKMCSGNLVFKVDTWAKDWWHDTIEPWKHYIPVDFNLTNLHKQYEWAENHPKEAHDIAHQGKLRCLETATIEAVEAKQREVMESLPPATKKMVEDAKAVIHGLGSFYDPICPKWCNDNYKQNTIAMEKYLEEMQDSPAHLLIGELSEVKDLEHSINAAQKKRNNH